VAGGPASAVAAGVLVAAGVGLALKGGQTNVPTAVDGSSGAQRFTVSASWSPSSVRPDEAAVLSGTVRPVRASEEVLVQRRDDDGWTTVAQSPVDERGRYRYRLVPATKGEELYRVRMPRVGAVAAGTSSVSTLMVEAGGR
jgi:hypothetical protein